MIWWPEQTASHKAEALRPIEALASVKPHAARRPASRAMRGVIVLGMSSLTACRRRGPFRGPASPDLIASRGYSLGPGDRLAVVVFRHPDLPLKFALDGEGYVALPLVGEMAAGGLTTSQLEEQIEAQLVADELLVNPHVGVQVVTYRSFYVVGEVGRPGSYEYQNGITVISAVALAGGYTPRADQSGVLIGRGDCRLATQADTRRAGRHPHRCRAVLLIGAYPATCHHGMARSPAPTGRKGTMQIVAKLPHLDDASLTVLHGNAERLLRVGTKTSRAMRRRRRSKPARRSPRGQGDQDQGDAAEARRAAAKERKRSKA